MLKIAGMLNTLNPISMLAFIKTRRPPDYSSNLCPPKTFAIYAFLGGVFELPSCCFLLEKAQNTPQKCHIENVLGGHRLDE